MRSLPTRSAQIVKALLVSGFVFVMMMVAGTVQQVRAEVITIHQNFESDTEGNNGRLNFFDPVYGNSNPNAENARIVVTLPVPDPNPSQVIVKKVVLEMHDHDESLVFDLRLNQNSLPNFASNIDIKTLNGALCNVPSFKTRLNNHHLPENRYLQDLYCYDQHIFDINQSINSIVLNISRKNGSGGTSTDQHVHIKNISWTIERPDTTDDDDDEEVEEIVGSCNSISAPDTVVKGQSVAISMSGSNVMKYALHYSPERPNYCAASNASPWTVIGGNDTTGQYTWNTSGLPAGAYYIAATAQLSPTQSCSANPSGSCGTAFTGCTQCGKKITIVEPPAAGQPTAALSSACSPALRTSGESLQYAVNLSSIDTKGLPLRRAYFYLDFTYQPSTNAVRAFLGTPSWSDWETNLRAPRVGDKFAYLLTSSNVMNNNSISFLWDDSIQIGTFKGNKKTLGQFEQFIGQSPATFTISTWIQTLNGAAVVENRFAASSTVAIGTKVCYQEPVCVRNCGACSIAGSSDGCSGTCEQGQSVGTPNPVQILSPAAGTALPANQDSSILISWRQNPSDNPAARLVDSYQLIIFSSEKYSSAAAADAARKAGATDIISLVELAAQGAPGTIYSRRIVFPQALLAGKVTIAVRAFNTTCSAENGGEIPGQPGSGIPDETEWEEVPNVEVEGTFSGNFYKSDSCTLADAEPIVLNSNSLVTVQNADDTTKTYTGFSQGSNYAVSIPAATLDYTALLSIDQGGQSETLSCAACNPANQAGACQLGRRTGPTNTANFFLRSYNLRFGSWWQARGGLVYGHSEISSNLPVDPNTRVINDDCRDAGKEYCDPLLVRNLLGGGSFSGGIPFTGGNFRGVDGWWTEYPGQPRANNGVDAKNHITIENFNYFMQRLETELTPDLTTNGTITSLPEGRLEKDAKVAYIVGDVTFSPNETLVIPSGEKRVIFVDGTLRISQAPDKIIEVQEGGFLSFIVSGDIIFEASVGHLNPSDVLPNTSLEANVEGVFIASNRIIVETAGAPGAANNDKKFVGAGTFVGWSGVELRRTFDDGNLGKTRNTTTPSESFLYRPDFLVNAPELIKFTELTWREVN